MAKTDTTKDATREPVKNLHIEVPEDFHTRLKMLCVIKKSTLKDYALSALEEKVARDEKQMHRESRDE
jgi:hypothetical protein